MAINPWDVALGVATGGLYTVGRAGYDLIANGGQGTVDTFNQLGKAAGDVGNAVSDFAGLKPTPVPGSTMDPNAGQIRGYDGWREMLAGGANWSQGRQVAGADARTDQTALSQMLMQQAMGQGPSIAQVQLQQAGDQNMAQAMALGASQRGGARGGAMRNIANQRAAIGQKLASDSAMLRLQEQMQARGMLGQHLQGMRGADLQGQALNDSLLQFYTQQGVGLDKDQADLSLRGAGMRANDDLAREQMRQQNIQTAQANRMGLVRDGGGLIMKASTGGIG